MRHVTGFAIALAFVLMTGASLAAGERPTGSPPESPVTVIDNDLRLILSNAKILETMHGLAARHGMVFSGITHQKETADTDTYRITFMGGLVPQDTGTFAVRLGLEGPPPVMRAVFSVSRPVINHVREGPPALRD